MSLRMEANTGTAELLEAAASKSSHPIKVYRGSVDKSFRPGMMVTPDLEYAASFGPVTPYYLTDETPMELSFSDFQALGQADGVGRLSGLFKFGGAFILTSPEQIKSAEPVLLDSEGNEVPLVVRFPPKDISLPGKSKAGEAARNIRCL